MRHDNEGPGRVQGLAGGAQGLAHLGRGPDR
jgi:hypothetical protein